MAGQIVQAQSLADIVAGSKKTKEVPAAGNKSTDIKPYAEIITKDAQSVKGLMDIHKVKDKYYLEIPRSSMGKPMLMTTKVSAISNNTDVIAGQMPSDPMFLEWSMDDERVYLLDANKDAICVADEPMQKGFERNWMKPVFKAFPIKTYSTDGENVVIDVTKFFCADERYMSPFIPTSPLDGMMKTRRMKGSFKSDMSSIISFKSFPKNIVFRTRMVYTVNSEPFTAEMTVSMMELSDKPMKPRYEDERIGYFTTKYLRFSDKRNAAEKISYINRWRLEPKSEDLLKFKAGELVEPAKPIVYYIDDAFPKPWRKYLKQGIEDWQKAFEEAGFKNAIIAKDFPENDPDFDPDDIRFSCVRYASTPIANAMGPSWVDPRSGEIIQGSVYFYHDVLKLVHDWRFIQTSVVDPSARSLNYDDMDVLGPLLRYLVAHEVGHTIGLLHNMSASYAYPVDSLRSPSFTKKYGTTPSIMDYARYNYVAQIGDNVEWLLPPILGVYDKYAIKWGYKPIFEAETPEEEKPILNAWIAEKEGDPMYHFGEQEFFNKIDPSAQTESIGDDAVLASEYGIKNLKILMTHLTEWTAKEGDDYSYTQHMYDELIKQFNRYINHAAKYIGGNFLCYPVHGDGKPGSIAVSSQKQKEALRFIFEKVQEMPQWLLDKTVTGYFRPINDNIYDMQSAYIKAWIGASSRVGYTSKLAKEDVYTQREYLYDLYHLVFGKALRGEKVDKADMNMEYTFVYCLFEGLDVLEGGNGKNIATISSLVPEDNFPCMWAGCSEEHIKTALAVSKKESDIKIDNKEITYGLLHDMMPLLKKRAKSGDKEQKNHYSYLLHEVEKVL